MKCFTLIIMSLGLIITSSLYADKVALLFLTIKDLNHSDLWKQQIELNKESFSIYIHSKEPLSNKYFKKFRIKHIVNTSWEIHLKAWQMLIQAAIKDTQNTKFVFLSESCIPLHPLKEIYNTLIEDNNTYMRFGKPWWPSQHNREVVELPKEHRWGNHEWVILNRSHAELMALDKTVIKYVSRHGSDAESYPSSLFSVCGCLDDSTIVNKITTYVNWEHNDGPHPHTFKDANSFNMELLQEAKKQCFFARKVASSFPEKLLYELINK